MELFAKDNKPIQEEPQPRKTFPVNFSEIPLFTEKLNTILV